MASRKKTKAGTAKMWDGVSKPTLNYRNKQRAQRLTDAEDFFGDEAK